MSGGATGAGGVRTAISALFADTASRLALGVVLVGVVLRLRLYFSGASLWLDEAMLANNLVDRSYAGLAQPLEYHQGAPVGFLFLQKAILQTLGGADYILRLWPLMAGIAALCLMYPVARRMLGAPGALTATALFALSPTLITYSATVKQYSTDALVALLLLLAGLVALDRYPSRAPWLALALGGALALWLSHPSLFILAGIGASLGLYVLARRDWMGLALLGGVIAVWAISFLAIYLISLRFLTADIVLAAYWKDNFLPMPVWQHLDWLCPAFLRLLANPGGLPATLGLLLVAAGSVRLLSKRWPVGLMLTLPSVATLAASAAQKYPFGDRLALFLLPSLYLLVGGGVELAGGLTGRVRKGLAEPISAAVGASLVLAVIYGAWIAEPYSAPVENVKPLLAHVEHHKQPGDVLFVYYGGEAATRYYAPFYDLANIRLVMGHEHRGTPLAYLAEVDRFEGERRVWVLFSHVCNWCQVDEQPYILQHLDTLGRRLEERQEEGAALYLYDMRSSP